MPPKSIAIPPNLSAPRGKRQAAVAVLDTFEAASPASLPPRMPRSVAQQPAHRYRVGERLRMNHGGYSLARAAASCKVIAVLPYEGHGVLLYRVRSDTEAFERVVAEADLSRNG